MSFSVKRMYQGNTSWDFLGVSRRVLVCSAVAVIICVAALLVRGLNLGIEFEGGGVWESPASEVITTVFAVNCPPERPQSQSGRH